MKQYIKYIVLFIILVFIGIIGINLYNNNQNFQGTTKNTTNTTANQNKGNNSSNSSAKTEKKEDTKVETEKKEKIKKEDTTNTTSSAKNNSSKSETTTTPSTQQSSTSTSSSTGSSSSQNSSSNTSSQSTNNNTNTTPSSNSGYNILDVETTTNTNPTSSTNKSSANQSISIYNSTDNPTIDVSAKNQKSNNNWSKNDNIIDIEIDNSSANKSSSNKRSTNSSTSSSNKKSSTSSNSTTKNSNSTTSSNDKVNPNNNSSSANNNQNKSSSNTKNTQTTTTTSTTQTTIKDGSIIGATGYGAVPSMNILRTKPSSNATAITRIELNKPFQILGKSNDGNWWKVKYNGKYGYVDNNYCLINLPDYIPSINYYMVEAIKNNSVSSGVKLSIYGKKLYTAGKVYNPRLEKNEFIVPVTYGFAKKILKAQTLALKDGYSLKIYDAYRPTSVAKQMRDSLTSLYNNNATVRRNINYSYENGNTYEWGQGWFIAQNLSAHSLASAIDVSLTKKGETKSLKMPSRINELSTKSIKYKYGVIGQTTVRNDLYSSNMTPAAKKLDTYMMNSGLTSLASEWWHFQDNISYSRMKNYVPNGLDFQPTTIVSTK